MQLKKVITIYVKYSNKKIEEICNNEKKMESFFKHDKLLIDGLKVLMIHFDLLDSIYDFWTIEALKGYNLEKITNSDKLSIRIIPKKRKKKERMILISINQNGDTIEIIEINNHDYKMKG